jgi:4-amino-4-deoxy-L-arabinose transferase-like glycosyltransferase
MKPFRLLTLAVFGAATLPRLAHRGMFVDGVTYAAIARNLAIGRGTFWNPFYTATIYPIFHEHPPLGFWLQSLWFRVAGDHLWVERTYSITAGLLTALLIAAFWRRLHGVDTRDGNIDGPRPDDGSSQQVRERTSARRSAAFSAPVLPTADLEWLPVLLWTIVPVVSWALVGNLLETTVAVFTTAAGLSAWRAMDRTPGRTSWSAISGLCIVAAVLTKGPVGFFPLVVPLAGLFLFDRASARRSAVVQWGTVAAGFLLLWMVAPARLSLASYLNEQVLAALNGAREAGRPFTILKTLIFGVLLPQTIAGLLPVAIVRRPVAPAPGPSARALVLFGIGLAGTLPILVSTKQAGHYRVPAVPFLALAVAAFSAPTVAAAIETVGLLRIGRTVRILTIVLALGTLAASAYPGLGRDRARLAEIDGVARTVPRDQTIGLCPASNADWGLHAWFERLFRVSLDATGQPRRWFLRAANENGCVPVECERGDDSRSELELLRCRAADEAPVR